jgi:hypothetical protein
MKSVSNWIFYIHKFSRILNTFLFIFLTLETGFGVSFKFFSTDVWGLDVCGMSATIGIPLATQGGACRSDRVGYKSPSVPTASVRSRCYPTLVSRHAPLLSPVPATPHHLLPICVGAHREEPPYHRSFDHLHCRDPLHGERSPKHPPCRLFL